METDLPTPEQVSAARAAAGLTQAEAGAVIGAAMRTWQDWESGARQMPSAKWELWQMKIKRSRRTPK